jgi:hypothetical protein
MNPDRSSQGTRITKPTNEDSFAYAFWLALGGEDYSGGMSAAFPRDGTFYLTGGQVPTLRELEENVLPKLREHFPQGVEVHDLLRFYAEHDRPSAAKIKAGKVSLRPFFAAAGHLMNLARRKQGKSLPEMQALIARGTPALKDKLELIEQGKITSPSIVRSAIAEVTQKLDLPKRDATTNAALKTLSGILQAFRR